MFDQEKFQRWSKMARKFHGQDFWSSIFNNSQAKEMMNSFSELLGEEKSFPRVDVYQTSHEFYVLMELPGVRKEDVLLQVVGDRLEIKGTVHNPYHGYQVHFKERFTGTFQRTVQLPDYVDHNQYSAKFVNGLLEIRLPRAGETPAKTLNID
ncbi:MAG TPA: Hsp20/alpha crystallin family protein [Desulfotomaculum sp.]|nr:Hsp20/alpha crystallin family protein [Desulfofundulus thermobenzoicus]HHW44365.1 Hsp20/alpha crystallin family protein [Desulfotomaculum sp.]